MSHCLRCKEVNQIREFMEKKRKQVDLDGSRKAFESYCLKCKAIMQAWLDLT